MWFAVGAVVADVDAVEERVVRFVGDSVGAGKSFGWLRVPTMVYDFERISRVPSRVHKSLLLFEEQRV